MMLTSVCNCCSWGSRRPFTFGMDTLMNATFWMQSIMDFQLKQDFAIWVKSSESAQRLSHHTGYCGKDPNKVIGANVVL